MTLPEEEARVLNEEIFEALRNMPGRRYYFCWRWVFLPWHYGKLWQWWWENRARRRHYRVRRRVVTTFNDFNRMKVRGST